MTTTYKYYVRYYKTTKSGKKYYKTIESPEYAFNDICSESMRNTIRNILSNPVYTIDSYWIESLITDSVANRVILTNADTFDLPF